MHRHDNLFLNELSKDKLSQAYVLARMAGEIRDEISWRNRIRRWQKTPGENKKGVISVQNGDGYVLALLFYSVGSTPELGRTLEVCELTVPDMFINSVVSSFVPILDQLAGILSCWTIYLPHPYNAVENTSALSQMGRIDGFQKQEDGVYRYLPVQKEMGSRKV